MRKLNAIVTAAILVLFVIHAIAGSFQMAGIGSSALKAVAWTAAGLVAVHTVISIILTAKSIKVWRSTGVGYFKENLLFWARRISGAAVMVFLIIHMAVISTKVDSVTRLQEFTTAKLVLQILLVATLALHVISNVKPLLISFGIKSFKSRTAEIIIILAVLLLVMAGAFIIYWFRWNG